MSIAKKIILDELMENSHPEKVEDVIFGALEVYANSSPEKKTIGSLVAYDIKERILDAQKNEGLIDEELLINAEIINQVFKQWN